jgi:DNA-binding NtrC family response regulator
MFVCNKAGILFERQRVYSTHKKSEMKPHNITSRKILVVDDEPSVCETVRMMLKLDGHEVKTADNAQSALVLFEREKFDVVITDYSMRPTKGDALAAAIKAHTPGQPVILITAYGEALRASATPINGVDCIVNKPFLLEDLRNAITVLTDCTP